MPLILTLNVQRVDGAQYAPVTGPWWTSGSATFPGWYPGRTPHLHFKVSLFAGARRTTEFTA